MHRSLLALTLWFPSSALAAEWPAAPSEAPWGRSPAGVEVQDVVVGQGAEVVPYSRAEVHYTGMLADGTVFDTSLERGQTLAFKVGAHQVIPGWEDGLLGMRVGGTRRLVIPSALGYGDRGMGSIPPHSTLYFEVQLIAITPPRAAPANPPEVAADAWIDGDGARYAEVVVGTGPKSKPGQRVCVDYALWQAGALVEQTWSRDTCTWFRRDDDDLPPGLDVGVARMREGGTRAVQTSDRLYLIELADTGK
ncbi:MAG: FKBP-type peptidyl-prolyl cis-trans isomerase [Myxococcota bacterium]